MVATARISDLAGADQAIAPTTVTAVTFDTEDFDTDGFADLGSSTTRLTIPTGLGGLYLVGGHVRFRGTISNFTFTGLRKNGSTVVQWQSSELSSATGPGCGVVFVDSLVATDYYELVVFTEGPDITHTSDGPYFWLVRLGDAP